MKVNKLIAALFLILGAQTVLAQGTTHPVNSSSKVKEGLDFPYAFVGIQGGGQTTFTNYNNWQLITPTASVSAGVHFNNIIAARLHVNGLGVGIAAGERRYGECRKGSQTNEI